MSEEEKEVNIENEIDEISAAEDDVTSNFTIIPNTLLRATDISPECGWIIMNLLSNKTGWKIKTSQLINHVKGYWGRDKVRKFFNEGIEAGYIERKLIYKKSAKGQLRGYCYKVASTPKFKKCLRQPDFQYTEDQCTDFQGPEDTYAKEYYHKENYLRDNTSLKVPAQKEQSAKAEEAKASEKEVKPSHEKKKKLADFTEEVKEVAHKIVMSLVRAKPDYPPTGNLVPICTHVDFMLRLDKRNPQKLLDVLNWALADDFWKDKMYKPNPAEYLRKQYDQLDLKMNAKTEKKVDRRTRNKDGSAVDADHLKDLF